ncbi:MAG: tetratricopeptide repeat protein [Xanthomonadales bacterium]|nr:tetratricopeptide repeat protein [Xanthomonadales bacterium]
MRAAVVPLLIVLGLGLAACERRAPAPAREPEAPRPSPEWERVRALREAAAAVPTALDVRPLAEPGIADRLAEAERLEAEGRHDEAQALLEQARARDPGSPEVLQHLAENALLRGDAGSAERLALEAERLGPGLGSLCLRHWLLIAEARHRLGRPEEALAARERAARCAVARPPRF